VKFPHRSTLKVASYSLKKQQESHFKALITGHTQYIHTFRVAIILGENSRTFQGLSSTFSRPIPAMFDHTRVFVDSIT